VDAPLNVCETRDVKGLYKKAREGQIKSIILDLIKLKFVQQASCSTVRSISTFHSLDFTGIDSPYEVPLEAESTMRTGETSIVECTQKLVDLLVERVNNISHKATVYWGESVLKV
jgi:hypothetical protein